MALRPNRLRAYRKRSGLSQAELAALLGLRSQSVLSELELAKTRPRSEVLLGCERIFDVSAAELFPGLATRVERAVLSRAAHLAGRTGGRNAERKRTHIAAIVTRLSHSTL
ncbi:MAG: helix-turn-helix transcriptional regulator [Alphaproteobacteria bacterium]|nr:helix-turn-helix transcriptional regulator [Alphaproteobacteria bacterium]MBV9693559.1 helix-turn-helix transcriptional regulator [Alphaproteobacteria bacterium]